MSKHPDESPPTLATLLPIDVLQRGSVIGVAGPSGVASLAFYLVAETLQGDRWGAALGWPELGAEAALEFGVHLEHLALVPDPGPKWLEVAGALIDAVDLLALRPHRPIPAATARRIAARARERGCLVVVTLFGSAAWPESFDARFVATEASWSGLGEGFGTVRQRVIDVAVDGRRVPVTRRMQLLLPATSADVVAQSHSTTSESDKDDGFANTA